MHYPIAKELLQFAKSKDSILFYLTNYDAFEKQVEESIGKRFDEIEGYLDEASKTGVYNPKLVPAFLFIFEVCSALQVEYR